MKRVAKVYGRAAVASLALLALLLVAVGWLSYRAARQLEHDARQVAHTLEVLDSIANVRGEVNRAEAMQRGFVITGQEGYGLEFEGAIERATGHVAALRQLVADNQAQAERVAGLEPRIREIGEAMRVAVEARAKEGFEAARAIVAGGVTRGRVDAVLGELHTMEEHEHDLRQKREVTTRRAFLIAATTGPLGACVALLCLAGFVQMLRRHLAEQAASAGVVHEQRERLHATLFSIGDAVIATDAEGLVETLNPVAETLTGWTQDDARGRSLEVVMPIQNEETRSAVENPVRRVIAEGRVVGLANHTVLLAKDGTERPIEDSAAPIRGPDGEMLGVVLVFRDVTEARRAEHARAARARFATLRSQVATALASAAPLAAALQQTCQAFVDDLGVALARVWTLDEAEGVLRLRAGAGSDSRLDGTHARVRVGELAIGDLAATRAPRLSNDVAHDPLVDDAGWASREGLAAFAGYPLVVDERVVGVLGLYSRRPFGDETFADLAPLAEAIAQYLDRKRNEDLVRERGELLRVTLASIGDAVITTDAHGRVTFLNDVAEALSGWSQAQAAGRPVEEVFHIENESTGEIVESPVAKVLREGVVVGLANHTVLVAKDGARRPIDDSGAPIRDAAGEIVGTVLVFRDVTERRRVDDELRASVERFRIVGRAANDVIWDWDHAADTVSWNENLRAVFGYAENERVVAAGWWRARMHPEDRERVERSLRAAIDAGDETWRDEYRFQRADGTYAFVHDRGYVLREGGRAVRMIGSMLDLTERRRAESELKDARARLDAALAVGAIGTWMWDVAQDRLYADRKIAQLLAVSPEEAALTSLATFIEAIHPDDRDHVAQTIRSTLDAGDSYEVRCRVVQSGGEVRWIAARGSLERDASGHPTIVSGVVVDVTEMKRAEERERHLARELELANAKFRAFFDQSSYYAGIVRLDGTVVDINRAALEQCGYRAEDVLGKPFWSTGWWSGSAAVQEQVRAACARAVQGESFRAELPYWIAGGQERLTDFTLSPMRDDSGAVIFLVPTGMDITDRKNAEEALRESEERFRGLADNLPQLAWMARPDGEIVWFNRRWYDYTGTTEAEMAAAGWRKVVDPDQLPRVVESLRLAFETGEPWEATFALRSKDGEQRWHLSRMVPVRDEGRRIVRWFGTNTDVTDRRLLEEELRRVAADLSESSRRKDEFLATLAHELRNPLAPVRNALEIMRSASHDPRLVEQARDTMARQIAQMVRLIDDLLDISRITRGKLELKREHVPLAVVVEGAVETSRPLIDADGHVLTVELPDEPVVLDADPTRLSQVLLNLLNNSAKYTPRGGRIELVARRDGASVEIRVRDNGIGIAAEMLPRIFDMFTQASQPPERTPGGLGIGLALARRLVELHGGTIEAHSAGIGRGSEFVVRLPCAVARKAAPRAALDDRPAPQHAARRRVLIVDDNLDAAESLAILLGMQGHEVRTAHDGLEALRVAEAFRPEVAVLDIGLPKLNGYEVARSLRAEPWAGEVLLIAVTGWGHESDRRRSTDAGFDHHLVKPVDPIALHAIVSTRHARG